MKTKLAIITLLAGAVTSHATLIDSTPGGFTIHETPPSVIEWIDNVERNLYLFDVAVLNYPGIGTGWVGNGYIPGGTYFNTDLFTFAQNPTSCSITWNLNSAPNWEMSWIWVQGTGDNYWNNIYMVPLDQLLAGNGTVELNGLDGIYSIGVLGQHIRDVPEDANTGALLFFAVIGLLLTYKARRRRIGHRV